MNFIYLFQIFQLLLAIYLLIMLFKKSNNFNSFIYIFSLTLLVISILFIPPIGRDFISGVNLTK